MIKNNKLVIQALTLLACIMFIVVSGCGKKTPPLPPEIKANKIAAPFNLKLKSDDTEIFLTWEHKTDDETAAVKPEGFEIFMVQRTFEACEGCPFEFKTAGIVSIPAMQFVLKIEKGFKYYFRIQALGKNDMRSEYSKTLEFEHK